jgi:hypothetical protein
MPQSRGLHQEFPHYAPGYYAAFFYDPDGIKLEVVYEPTRATPTSSWSSSLVAPVHSTPGHLEGHAAELQTTRRRRSTPPRSS